MHNTIDVMVQNVQALPAMPQEHVEEDVNATAASSELIFWQEINKTRYRSAVKNIGPEWGHLLVQGMGNIGGCAISWHKDRFKVIQKGKVRLVRGFPGICGKRFITWALLLDTFTGVTFLVHNFHYPAGAWSKKPQTMRKRRQKMWQQSNRKHLAFVTEWVDKGYCVIGGGDLNRMFFNVVGKEVSGLPVGYTTAPASIDELFFISNTKNKIVCTDIDVADRNSDHAGRWARLFIKKVK